jgi:membrane-bound ClpP family serine protease
MWIGVGVLLGLVVLASALGFHVGPHGHLVGFALGVAAAIWLMVMAATGRSQPLLWVLFGADVAISGGLGAIAWRGLKLRDHELSGSAVVGLVGAEGVAVTDLEPGGVVRVRGENWSATSVNGSVIAGHRVQVIEASGVRLSVWSEDEDPSELEGHRTPLRAHWHYAADGEQEGAQ